MAAVAVFCVFLVDVFMKPGYAPWLLYSAMICFVAYLEEKRDIIVFSLASALLIWVGYAFTLPPDGLVMPESALFNRVSGTLALLLIATFFIRPSSSPATGGRL